MVEHLLVCVAISHNTPSNLEIITLKLKDMHKRPKLDEEWQAIQELFLTKVKATDENYQTKEKQSTRKRTKMLK